MIDDKMPGIAMICDLQGRILECLHNNLNLRAEPAPHRSLTQIVDRGSLQKALSFLAKIREEQATFGWEINVPCEDEVMSLHFAGFISNETMLIVGAKTNHGLQTLYEELMRINNEQMNSLRTSIKSHTEVSQERETEERDFYDEIARLNNELVAMQRELAKKNAQLERLNEQKNQFLGMAAHDLRNPLHVILSFSEFLLDEIGGDLEEDYRELLETIQTSSLFMTRLINDLLDVAKIESGKLELHRQPTDLVALVKRNVDRNRLIASNKEIDLRLTTEPLPTMDIDPDKIDQVLNNLISNAIKYSHPHTRVDVRLQQKNQRVVLSVQDQGQGIPAEEIDRLFQPFQKTSVRSIAGEKSTGLGLVIVKRIVKGHGGKIWVESEVGKGSTFFVSLPLNAEER